MRDSVANADESAAQTAVEKPVRLNSVVIGNGVKKTIVDADENEPVVKDPVVKEKDTLAKLDSPGIELGRIKPASVNTISSTPSDRIKSGTAKSKRKTATANFDVREAQPTASGDRSLIRALGLKIGKIVIDPGHGGHDTGTIGPNGLEEKDLVLDVSRRLGKLLQTRLGAEVIYTRKDDTFIPLETRTAIANQEAADLFVSVHANSSHDSDAR
jgi:N-acetylmuramoyl-L-alanine amidase